MDNLLDLHTDYLLSSFGQTTAVGLSQLLNRAISHDRITRFLSRKRYTSADLWRVVKPLVRQVQSDDAVLIVDDSLAEKPYTDENAIVCWHYDHSHNRMIKGINFIYHKRWNVEPYHKSLKPNASLERSPMQTVVTQTNHLFASLCAYIKLEMLKCSTQLNHFALKTKLYVGAIQVAFATLRQLQPVPLAA